MYAGGGSFVGTVKAFMPGRLGRRVGSELMPRLVVTLSFRVVGVLSAMPNFDLMLPIMLLRDMLFCRGGGGK